MNWAKLLTTIGVKQQADELMTAADYEFMKYITEYGKHYGTKAEYQYRLSIFKENLAHIEDHNSKNGETHVLGINAMSDWSEEEYNKLLGYKHEMKTTSNVEMLDTSNLKDDINWVT